MKKIPQFCLLFLFMLSGTLTEAQDVFKLWEGQKKPYYKENTLQESKEELWGTWAILNVIEPTLTVYEAKGENSGKAVIIIPGGGYEAVAMYHEGYDVAETLSALGITAAVLKYRLPNPESSDQAHLVPLTDARRATKLLRAMAGKYGFDDDKVGLLGFSAGSHLATVASLWESDVKEENPDYTALIYGVTNLSEINLLWLEESLYFRKLTNEEIDQNKLLDLVSENSVPAFLVHAYDDDVCLIEETTLYAQRLHEHGVAVEVHLFPKGGHGFGVGREEDGTDQWTSLFVNWLKSN
jgi:acetyl esterase/lipase